MDPTVSMNTPDVLNSIARYLPSNQAANLSLITRNFPIEVNEQYNVYYIAMERGYPYFPGMTLSDLYIYENSTLSEIMYQAGKFGDQRVIYYWLGHTVTDKQVDTDDLDAIKQACIGLVQMQHDALLEKVMNEMPVSISIRSIIMSEAAQIGNIHIVEMMLDDNTILYGTAAGAAALYGHTTLVWLLINKGYQNYDMIMIRACAGGHEDIVEDMLHLGATNYNGGLQSSISSGNINLVRRMLQLGADPRDNEDNAGSSNMEIVHLLEDAVSDMYGINYDELLNAAAVAGNTEIFDYALLKGADPKDALTSAVEGGHIDMVRKVMDLGVVKVTALNIHEALSNCRMDIVDMLTEKIDVDMLNGNYSNSLRRAGQKGCIPAVIWCLDHGAGINISAIAMIAQLGKINIIKILLNRSGDKLRKLAIDKLRHYGYYRKADYLEQSL